MEAYKLRFSLYLEGKINQTCFAADLCEAIVCIFTEEVTEYFDDNEVIYMPNSSFVGVSGNTLAFNFAIPHFRQNSGKYIKAMNYPSKTGKECLITAL